MTISNESSKAKTFISVIGFQFFLWVAFLVLADWKPESIEPKKYNIIVCCSLVFAGVVHFFTLPYLLKVGFHFKVFCLLFIAFRVPLFWSEAYKEDDYYRYLWDGVVTLNGDNALIIAPEEVHFGTSSLEIDESKQRERNLIIDLRRTYLDPELRDLILDQINYPESPSIYGPTLQGSLALQTLIANGLEGLLKNPNAEERLFFRLQVLKLFLLCFEALAAWLLFQLLKRFSLHPNLIYAFSLSPLLLKEIGNSLHADIIPATLLLASIYALTLNRTFASALALALTIGAKSFALPLFPFLFLASKRKVVFAVIGLGALGLLYAPYISGGQEIFTGTQYFAKTWSMNDFLTAHFRWLFYQDSVHQFLGLSNWSHQTTLLPMGRVSISPELLLARNIGLGLFATAWSMIFFRFWKNRYDEEQVIRSCADVLFVLYLCAPVQNPWYLIWGLGLYILTGRWAYLFFIAIAELYLFNFSVESTVIITDPLQGWLYFQYAAFLVFMLWQKWGPLKLKYLADDSYRLNYHS